MHNNISVVIVHYLCYYCNEMKDVAEYIQQTFGLQIVLKELSDHKMSKLPLYIKANYDWVEAKILNADFVLIKPIAPNTFSPGQLEKQAMSVKDILGFSCIFILENVESWERKRLVERKISFIEPARQIFVPALLLDLNDLKNKPAPDNIKRIKLSAPAQFAILYHLEVGSLEQMPFLDISNKLGYSKMTVSRIIRELTFHKLIEVSGSKEKQFIFGATDKKTLWTKVLPLLESPLKDIIYTDQPVNKNNNLYLSYDTALSTYSMLSQGKRTAFAIGKESFRSLNKHTEMEPSNENDGNFRVEVWNYPPAPLSNGGNVDRLSLYLLMKDEEDERIKIALEEMLNTIEWL